MHSVNAIRYFHQGNVWFAYSNNTIGVYPIKDGLINFNSFEKKIPFEVLEIKQFSDSLYLAGGFYSQLAILNHKGHFIAFVGDF
jgi:hypothetical protein